MSAICRTDVCAMTSLRNSSPALLIEFTRSRKEIATVQREAWPDAIHTAGYANTRGPANDCAPLGTFPSSTL